MIDTGTDTVTVEPMNMLTALLEHGPYWFFFFYVAKRLLDWYLPRGFISRRVLRHGMKQP